ncbi:MAG: 2-oxoglutarate dehydrogenase E1 component [Alphaproteobacteria bacterium]|nr:2-oxoglutarate dehydrogenase E1 component [Alphaproteobacteria bacterium]
MSLTNAPVFDPASLPLVEDYYAKFKANPASVGAEWQAYFLGWEGAGGGVANAAGSTPSGDGLAEAWRTRGHLVAQTNPLKPNPRRLPELEGAEAAKWQALYGGSVGLELGAVREPAERAWLQAWWESNPAAPDTATRTALYEGLFQANAFEQFLHKKFVGVKRFSVEGNDGVVPLLHQLATWHSAQGQAALAKSMVIGMAHRGRLNVLCNVLHKPLAEMFAGFADTLKPVAGAASAGDVKYHLGKVYEAHYGANAITLQLLFNPSHLEAVNPSVLGVARARQERGEAALPVLIHGDSAVAGQGVVAECNNLMSLAPYRVGGTLHLVLNNQVGFTGDPADTWGTGSEAYCTDIFKALGVPIFHCNADDIEACWRALRCAYEYRQQFGKDAVLDLVGYRRWGHNEGDDPTFTQPKLYALVRPHPTPAEVYKPQALAAGVSKAALEQLEAAYTKQLDEALKDAQAGYTPKAGKEPSKANTPETGAEAGAIKKVAEVWGKPPSGFVYNEKVKKVIDERVAMLYGEKPLNWGAAEVAAYGTLAQEGLRIRLTGQDVQRGTFSHRQCVLTCSDTNSRWNVLNDLAQRDGQVYVANSALSENAVLGFEYGYSLIQQSGLTIWEGQFGDFANGAQVVIDQFIASAEAKWAQTSNVVLLLPHGYEGQGPEHSSARLERFLQLCADSNLRVCVPSTPAQIFHLLRHQAKQTELKPLIVMTPKSLLRNPAAVSPLSDLLRGSWQPVLPEAEVKQAKRVVLCSGKVYYDLLAKREAEKRTDVALIRVEQLYPFPAEAIAKALSPFKPKEVLWVQEEPRNMGSWAHVREYWDTTWGYLHYAGRPASASPAVGTTSRHNAEQAAVLAQVFGENKAKAA